MTFGSLIRTLTAFTCTVTAVAANDAKESGYVRAVTAARAERLQRLTKADGWLSLVGLYFLRAGENRIGTGAENAIVLSTGPAHLGTVTLEPDGSVYIAVNPGADVLVDGRQVLRAKLEEEGERNGTQVTSGSLSFFVIERGGRKALRIKDRNSARRHDFAGVDYFPIDPSWRIEAKWVDFDRSKEVTIANILGQEETALIPGKAVFEREGRTFELLPLVEGVDEPLLFVISDLTSEKETYAAARFVYADPPRGGKIILDFNEAVNPPCAFTPFATCPLPPKENRLPIAVNAGEKKYRGSAD
ncbi:MAG: DUF1684 domain-containing protein [Opitutus sp.]